MNNNPQMIQIVEALHIPLRWWWTLVAGLCLGLACGIVIYEFADKLYESETKIFVSPGQIPKDFVRSTVTEDMSVRLRSLEEAVLSREYLTQLVEQVFQLPRGTAEHSKVVSRLQQRVTVRLAEFDSRRGAGLFVLTYRDTDPQRAADVVNSLAEIYISENFKLRTRQAESTAGTLESLAGEMRDQLETKERRIAEFRSAHLYELAENSDANLRLLSGRQADLEANEQRLGQARDRLRILREEKARGATELDQGTPTIIEDPLVQRLHTLEDELHATQLRYTTEHPAVKALTHQIIDLKEQIASRSVGSTPERTNQSSEIDVEIESVEQEIARLENLERKWRADVDLYRSRVEASPRVQQQLAELTKGYEVLQQRYDKLEGNYQEAKGSLRVEESRKGSQFDVVEKAVPAKNPISPQKNMIYGGSALAGLLLFVAPLLLRSLFSPRIHSAVGVEALSEVTVLANIDLLGTPAARKERRTKTLANLAASLIAVAALAAVLIIYGGILG